MKFRIKKQKNKLSKFQNLKLSFCPIYPPPTLTPDQPPQRPLCYIYICIYTHFLYLSLSLSIYIFFLYIYIYHICMYMSMLFPTVSCIHLRKSLGASDHYQSSITLQAEQLESVNLCSTSYILKSKLSASCSFLESNIRDSYKS